MFYTVSLVKFRKRAWPIIKIAIIFGVAIAIALRVHVAISS